MSVQTETDERRDQTLGKPRLRLSIWIPTIFLVLFVGGSIFMGMRSRPDTRPGVEFSPPPATQSSEVVFKGFGAQKDRTLSEFEGKPLVVNYFASWCSPCRKEMKALQTAHAAYQGDVVFLGVNFRDLEDDAVEILRTARVTYAIASDFEGVTMRQLLDRSGKKARYLLPITFFVDEEGRVVDVVSGALDDDELRQRIKTSFTVAQ